MDRPCCFNNHKQALQPARMACVDSRIESGGELGRVNSNLERHARQDHMVRITRGNGCQARMPQHLPLSGMSRYHLGACPATTYKLWVCPGNACPATT